MSIKQNITSLQSLLEVVNALPEVGGVELPILTNEGIADDLVTGKELINSEGNIVTGTNPYEKVATDTEVNTQADLIAQISAALEGKTNESGSGGIQWISCSTMQTTYVVGTPGSQLYYIELPHENCYVLFFNHDITNLSGCHMGCYDVKSETQTTGCHLIYGGDTIPSVINDDNTLYLQISSSNILHTAYYAIISESLLPLKEVI